MARSIIVQRSTRMRSAIAGAFTVRPSLSCSVQAKVRARAAVRSESIRPGSLRRPRLPGGGRLVSRERAGSSSATRKRRPSGSPGLSSRERSNRRGRLLHLEARSLCVHGEGDSALPMLHILKQPIEAGRNRDQAIRVTHPQPAAHPLGDSGSRSVWAKSEVRIC